MIKVQLKPNFDPTFLLSLKEKLQVDKRESLKLKKERNLFYKLSQSWI
jgi:hypothetical protein